MSNALVLSEELTKIDSVLAKHNLKKTPLRRKILLTFTQAESSLTQAELISAISKNLDNVDRVSIYRNLLNLKDAGVLHEVDTNHYIFCSHDCGSHAHLLLFCQSCRKHKEVKDHRKINTFMEELAEFRFFDQRKPIFLRGVCSGCT